MNELSELYEESNDLQMDVMPSESHLPHIKMLTLFAITLPSILSPDLDNQENGHWTVVHSGGRRMREKWEKDRAVSNFFKKVSMGDCRAWLRDFLVHWEEMSTTTVPVPGKDSAQEDSYDESGEERREDPGFGLDGCGHGLHGRGAHEWILDNGSSRRETDEREMGERQGCDRLLQHGLHGRLSGLASGFYGELGANVEDLGITDHGPPYSAAHGHSQQAHHLDPPQFHHNCLPVLSPFQEQQVHQELTTLCFVGTVGQQKQDQEA
ncbi:hypothetical protein MJG53_009090 [Ovis ammon polii x Ovis aries]|uniref:Uncharacterized protein n=1 Tax=Ovis ammon polii x Ovis aries TaxID=2918886 RepID=A0ACB9UYE8_9CETA|nr:hypothetical protein MJG53_009090 [Ovis ammon polii x Ovis aries]